MTSPAEAYGAATRALATAQAALADAQVWLWQIEASRRAGWASNSQLPLSFTDGLSWIRYSEDAAPLRGFLRSHGIGAAEINRLEASLLNSPVNPDGHEHQGETP